MNSGCGEKFNAGLIAWTRRKHSGRVIPLPDLTGMPAAGMESSRIFGSAAICVFQFALLTVFDL